MGIVKQSPCSCSRVCNKQGPDFLCAADCQAEAENPLSGGSQEGGDAVPTISLATLRSRSASGAKPASEACIDIGTVLPQLLSARRRSKCRQSRALLMTPGRQGRACLVPGRSLPANSEQPGAAGGHAWGMRPEVRLSWQLPDPRRRSATYPGSVASRCRGLCCAGVQSAGGMRRLLDPSSGMSGSPVQSYQGLVVMPQLSVRGGPVHAGEGLSRLLVRTQSR